MKDDLMNDFLDSPKYRGIRLRELRKTMNLKRYELAELVGVSSTSISIWENATVGKGLTEEGAQKVIKSAKEQGYFCTMPWLLYGIGEPPKLKILNKEKEIKIFLSSSADCVVAEMPDNSMYPALSKGDFVGGLWELIDKNIDFKKKYIVQIGDSIQIRMLKQGNNSDTYEVYSLCDDKNSLYPSEIKDVKLEKIAKIIRIWND